MLVQTLTNRIELIGCGNEIRISFRAAAACKFVGTLFAHAGRACPVVNPLNICEIGFGNQADAFVSEADEAANGAGLYSFSDKYIKPKAREKFAPLPAELRGKIRAYTRTLYRRSNLTGVVRMDYLVCDDEVYLGEVNTVPGSLAYYLFCERLSDARTFFTDLIENAVLKQEKRIIQTGVLDTVSTGGKRGSAGVRI